MLSGSLTPHFSQFGYRRLKTAKPQLGHLGAIELVIDFGCAELPHTLTARVFKPGLSRPTQWPMKIAALPREVRFRHFCNPSLR